MRSEVVEDAAIPGVKLIVSVYTGHSRIRCGSITPGRFDTKVIARPSPGRRKITPPVAGQSEPVRLRISREGNAYCGAGVALQRSRPCSPRRGLGAIEGEADHRIVPEDGRH